MTKIVALVLMLAGGAVTAASAQEPGDTGVIQSDSNAAHAAGAEAVALPSEAGPAGTPALDPDVEERARALNMRLRCPVCQSSSIEESPSAQALEMKAVIREKLAAGESEKDIEDYFVSKYGEWVLLEPPARGINLLVYLLPVLLVLGGGFFVYRMAKKWTAAPDAEQVNAAEDAAMSSPRTGR